MAPIFPCASLLCIDYRTGLNAKLAGTPFQRLLKAQSRCRESILEENSDFLVPLLARICLFCADFSVGIG